jgi:hypothetical protein
MIEGTRLHREGSDAAPIIDRMHSGVTVCLFYNIWLVVNKQLLI